MNIAAVVVCERVFRIEINGCAVIRHGPVVILPVVIDRAAGIQYVGLGRQFEGLIVVGQSGGFIIQGPMGQSALVKRIVVLRIELDGLVRVGNDLAIIFLGIVGMAAGVVDIVARIEVDGGIEVGNRLVQFLLRLIGQAPVIQRAIVFRFEPDGLAVVGNGLVVLFDVVIGQAAVIQRVIVSRFEADGLAVVGDGLVVLFDVVIGMPAAKIGDRLGFQLEGGIVIRNGLDILLLGIVRQAA